MLWRIVHEQVEVFCLAVRLDQLRRKVGRDFLEDRSEPLEGIAVKDLSAILCNKDQMDVKLRNTMPAAANLT